MFCTAACGCAHHYLIYPREPPPQTITWSADFSRDQILVHIEGARPLGPGPFPVVIVHPEGGGTAADMKGVLWDLAGRGYFAVAADYKRLIDGKYQRNMFVWRSPADVTIVLDVLRAYPEADQSRVGLLGFSQGGVVSLLIAAHAPDRVQAVVSYYPVTDFPHWFAIERSVPRRWGYDVVRWYFRRESGTSNDAEFKLMLERASPYYLADSIRAPVLLVHGAKDTTAPVEESERMAARLAAGGKTVKLLVVPDAVHIFNFRQPEEGKIAWKETLEWLSRYLQPSPPSRTRDGAPPLQGPTLTARAGAAAYSNTVRLRGVAPCPRSVGLGGIRNRRAGRIGADGGCVHPRLRL